MTTSMNVSLPEALKAFVQQRVADEHFANPSDYVRHLIRQDKGRVARERLEAQILEGMVGEAEDADAADWQAIRQEVRERLGE